MSDKKAFRIPVWNGLLEHCTEMGEAIWLFLWYIDKTTKEKTNGSGDTLGAVLGGMPCRDSDAASALGVSTRQIGRWRTHLAEKNYIETTRTPVGYSIRVKKSKKWVGKGSDKNVVSKTEIDTTKMSYPSESDTTETVVDTTETVVDLPNATIQYRQNKDYTETKQKQREVTPLSLVPLSRVDFESDWDIPVESFLEAWPCPEDQNEAYRWMDHVRLRLGDALCSRNHWAECRSELLKNPKAHSELTPSELDERIARMTEASSLCEQLVRDSLEQFEASGSSIDQYHAASTLRLYSSRQVFDAGHTY
jgi:hypothetical protein